MPAAILLGPAVLSAAAALADVTIVKTGEPSSVEAGSGVAYTITVTNTGSEGRQVAVHDALPGDVVFWNLFINGEWVNPHEPNPCSLPTQGTNDGPIDCMATLAPQESVVYTIGATLRWCFPEGQTVTNTATAWGAPDPPASSSWSFVSVENPQPYCDDGNACTKFDMCVDDTCLGQPLNGCPDNSVCTIDSCDPEMGCVYTPIECADGDPCTDNACDSNTGCFFPSAAAGTPCPFTGPCAVSGVCNGAGTCVGVSVCDDANPCTEDFTDYQNACACSHAPRPLGTSCSDANDCTLDDACDGAGHCDGTLTGEVPPDIGNTVRLQRGGTVANIQWTPVPEADDYQVLRGTLSTLPVGSGSPEETCIAPEQVPPSRDDFAVPPLGEGFWYLVRGVNVCRGPGPYGFQGDHGAPGAPRVSTTCP